ncbi:MAG: lytic transglycosylase domain-containing protein [Velocimicrobium sp.]
MIGDLNSVTGRTYMSIEHVSRKQETVKTQSSGTFTEILNQALTNDDSTTKLNSIFEKAADTYHISSDLLKAVAKAESDFDSTCISTSGACGIMQLMPDTADELGVTDSFDAEQNIMGGAKYLSDKLKEYNGDTSLALAAYNAGSGNVNKYGGIPPFSETQNYVKKIRGYLQNGYE